MKNSISRLWVLSSLFVALNGFAFAASLEVTDVSRTQYSVNDNSNNFSIYGKGFFPGNSIEQAFNDIQVNFRQISPQISDWQTASHQWNGTRSVWISDLAPNEIDITLSDAILGSQSSWSFIVCVRTLGCSNAVTIFVKGGPATPLTVDPSVDPTDLGVGYGGAEGYTLKLPVLGLSTFAPVIRMGSFSYTGEANPYTGMAFFNIPATALSNPAFFSAYVTDPLTDTDSNSFGMRVFGKPNPVSGLPIAINQSLTLGQNPQEAQLTVKFADMTFPNSVQFVDGSTTRSILVPMDLLTNQAKITIPGSALRRGSYEGSLLFKNQGGETSVPVSVSISGMIIHPTPFPTPFPTPTFPIPTVVPTVFPTPIPTIVPTPTPFPHPTFTRPGHP